MAEDIFTSLSQARDEKRAQEMSAYMRNLFPFLGISKPDRARISKDFLREKKKDRNIDWDFIASCYAKKEREWHYLALDYLGVVEKLLVESDISRLEKLIITNSWWDSTDCIDSLVAGLVWRFPGLKRQMMAWAQSENIWLRRTAIDFQLKYKENTDTELLSSIIEENLDTKEFFIDKAIGWALREYSKTNKEWVGQFITSHQLSKLSKREGSKYL